MMKRLCIYFFYDKEGLVDEYVVFFLKSIRKFCEELCLVSNSIILENSIKKINSICDNIIIRENFGLDAWAYKHALEFYGYDELKKYDEIICCNFTFFGPFYPLNEMFETMNTRTCDWWGLHKWWTPYPVDYHHIPSFFVVYKKSLICSNHFKNYWTTLKNINTYDESVEYHEQRQTPYYDKRGFKSSVYLESDNYSKEEPFLWPLKFADLPIIEKRYPFIKRRCFYIENYIMKFKCAALNTVSFLKSTNNNYDIKMIKDNIIRTQKIEECSFVKKMKYKILSMVSPSAKRRKRYHEKYRNSFFIKEISEISNQSD